MADFNQLTVTDVGEDKIHCLMIPLKEGNLLLPYSSISEIMPFAIYDPVDDGPAWLLGQIMWQRNRVPLISFDALNQESQQRVVHEHRLRVVLIKTLVADSDVQYIAIAMQGIPRLTIVERENIRSLDASPKEKAILSKVEVEGREAMIPDIDALEYLVSRFLKA